MNMGMQLLNFYGEKSKGPLNMYWLEQNFAFYSLLPRTWSSKRSALLALAECLLAIGFSGVRWSTCCFKNKMRSLRPLFLSKSNNSHLRCRYYKLRKTYILTSGLNILSRMTLCTVWYAKIHSNHLLVASPDAPQMASWTLKPARSTPACSTPAEPEVFWCTAEMCCIIKPRAPWIKPQNVRDSTERAGEEPTASGGISMSWASFLRVTEPHRLSQKCLAPEKGSLFRADSSQHRTRSKQACLEVGVWTQTASVCFEERDCMWLCLWTEIFSFYCLPVWLLVPMLRKCLCAEKLLFCVHVQSSCCRGQWWDERSTRSSHVLYRNREMPLTRIQLHHSMAAAQRAAASQHFWTTEQLNILWARQPPDPDGTA